MRNKLYIQLLLLSVVIGAITFVISLIAIPWLPKVASEEGEKIDDIYLFTSVICIVIFAIVPELANVTVPLKSFPGLSNVID